MFHNALVPFVERQIITMDEKKDIIFDLLIDTLNENNVNIALEDFDCFPAIVARKNGKKFSDEEHLEGIIFSLLSSQRPWEPILHNKQNIKKIFYNFEFEYILNKDAGYFETEIRKIKCGNKSIHRQMGALSSIVEKLLFIKREFGSLDAFVCSDKPVNIAKEISTNRKYKIPELGFALALEYLRNVGIDVSKPDTQLCRLFGKARLGYSSFDEAHPNEVVRFIEQIAKKNRKSQAEVGTTFWMLCAKDYGNICSRSPKCDRCRLCTVCNMNTKSGVI